MSIEIHSQIPETVFFQVEQLQKNNQTQQAEFAHHFLLSQANRYPTPFLYSLINRLQFGKERNTRQEFVGPNIYLELDKPRQQFNDQQEITLAKEKNPKLLPYLETQISAHLMEHALSRHIFEFSYQLDSNGRIHAPHQQSSNPFTFERLQALITDSQDYLKQKFGVNLTNQDLVWLDQNLENVAGLIFDKEFWQTRVGLELAELLGLRQLEKFAVNSQTGDLIALFSPWSDKRQTANICHFTMLATVEDNKIKVISVRSQQRPQQYLQTFERFSKTQANSAQEAVSQPFVVARHNVTNFLTNLEKSLQIPLETKSDFISLYDRAVRSCRNDICDLAYLIWQGKTPAAQIQNLRENLEQKIVAIHKQLVGQFRQKNNLKDDPRLEAMISSLKYLAGGACGISNSIIRNLTPFLGLNLAFAGIDLMNGFECPRCHRFIPKGSGDTCPTCLYTKQQHAILTGVSCG